MVALLGTRQQHLLGRTYTYDLHKPYLGTFYFSRYTPVWPWPVININNNIEIIFCCAQSKIGLLSAVAETMPVTIKV